MSNANAQGNKEMKPNPTNTDDVIDSRNVIERIEELEDLAEDNELDLDDKQELAALKELASEASGYACGLSSLATTAELGRWPLL